MSDALLGLLMLACAYALGRVIGDRHAREALEADRLFRARLAASIEAEERRFRAECERPAVSRRLEGALTYCEMEEL